MRVLLGIIFLAGLSALARAETISRAYLVTNSISVNETVVHLINSAENPQSFQGSLFAGNGERLGDAEILLHNGMVQSQGRIILNAEKP